MLETDCGNSIENGGTNSSISNCDSPCTGNADETCGAGGEFHTLRRHFESHSASQIF